VTDYERAELRLKAFQALTGWGVTVGEIKVGDKAIPERRSLNMTEQMQRANELFEWMVGGTRDAALTDGQEDDAR
jgi:hypothetical protein